MLVLFAKTEPNKHQDWLSKAEYTGKGPTQKYSSRSIYLLNDGSEVESIILVALAPIEAAEMLAKMRAKLAWQAFSVRGS